MTPAGPPEVITLGECLIAFVSSATGPLAEAGEFQRVVVGAEANVAVGLARLGHRSAFIGRVGDDDLGVTITRALRGEGVDVSHLGVGQGQWTGLLVRNRMVVGPPTVEYRRAGSAGAALGPDDVAAASGLFDTAAWLHVTGITPALSSSAGAAVAAAVEIAVARGLRVSLDLNLRRKLWTDQAAGAALRPLASRVEIVMGSPDELAVLAGHEGPADGSLDPDSVARSVLALGPATVVVKLGADGALEAGSDNSVVRGAAIAVAALVDPVGAGDAFAAGWIAAALEGLPAAERLGLANACGAAAIGAIGDQAGLPSRAEADRLRSTGAGEVLR